MRILIFSSEERKALYRQHMEKAGFASDVVNELVKVYSSPYSERLYSGILVDAPTLFEGKKGDKDLLQGLWDIFPVFLMDVEEGKPKPFAKQKFRGGLTEFVNTCIVFSPRPVRAKDRADLHLHLLLGEHPDLDDGEATFTLNISERGCFAVTAKKREAGSELWLRFCELDDPAPIRARVCWQSPWGFGRHMPGIGLQFTEVSKKQQDFLKYLILTSWVPQKGK